jgi:serine protease DegQ
LPNGNLAPAKLLGVDPETDLALLSVAAPNLQPIVVADMRTVAVGDVVLAVGNPLGVGQTVTQGIVSALGRKGIGINTIENFIQTDAAINPAIPVARSSTPPGV